MSLSLEALGLRRPPVADGIAELWMEDETTLHDGQGLMDAHRRVIDRMGWPIHAELPYSFSPIGFSGLFLLGSSHYAIHAWPEGKYKYQRVWSEICNTYEIARDFSQKLFDEFRPKVLIFHPFNNRNLNIQAEEPIIKIAA